MTNFFVVFGSYILISVCMFGLFALFVRIFTILFKK